MHAAALARASSSLSQSYSSRIVAGHRRFVRVPVPSSESGVRRGWLSAWSFSRCSLASCACPSDLALWRNPRPGGPLRPLAPWYGQWWPISAHGAIVVVPSLGVFPCAAQRQTLHLLPGLFPRAGQWTARFTRADARGGVSPPSGRRPSAPSRALGRQRTIPARGERGDFDSREVSSSPRQPHKLFYINKLSISPLCSTLRPRSQLSVQIPYIRGGRHGE